MFSYDHSELHMILMAMLWMIMMMMTTTYYLYFS